MTAESYFYYKWLIIEKKMTLEKYSALTNKEMV